MNCLTCDKPATHIRFTQFAGNHPYCKEHAEQEPDFNDEDDSYQYWKEIKCWCHTCRPISTDMRMVLCPSCGNKRCPRATDHRNECTNSNEPNQEGSIY